jgi:hypothetical protein
MRWLITEKAEYLVEAPTREEAELMFLDHGPELDEAVVTFAGVIERDVEPADGPDEVGEQGGD